MRPTPILKAIMLLVVLLVLGNVIVYGYKGIQLLTLPPDSCEGNWTEGCPEL